jgi:hypothetical protein
LGGDPQADRVDRRAKDRLAVRSVVAEYLDAKKNEIRPRTLVETTAINSRVESWITSQHSLTTAD